MDFISGSNPALAGAAVASHGLVVLVVDDCDDDELVAAIAAATSVPADGFRCGWAAQLRGDAIVVRFSVVRLDDAFEWRWTYPDPATEFLQVAAAADHLVAILPRELAGDIRGNLEPERLGGALIVAAPRAHALRAVLPWSRPA